MSFSVSLNQLREITNAAVDSSLSFPANSLASGIATDSRALSPGEVFLALRGEKFDGHDFVPLAAAGGAIACLVERPVGATTIPQLQVPDTLVAYQQIAHWWRDRFTLPVIAVTGSVGKTTTKELISAVLGTQGKVHKTQKNYNNEIGVPKTLLDLTADDDFAVIEMAMRAKGEIALLSQITRPTIALITNVGTAHIGRLGSEQAIAEAKCELLAEMPATSLAILNHDNPLLQATAKSVWQGEIITYGLEGGDIRGELLDYQTLRLDGLDFPLPLLGRHNALNYLAALTVGKVLGIDWTPLTAGVSVSLPSGRSRRCQLPDDILLLDETYNAGLESTLAALRLLAETPGQRHIAVLGAMKELGEHSPRLHCQVGEKVKELGIDQLFVLAEDPEAEAIIPGASPVPTTCAATRADLLQQLIKTVQPGDRLLFKASNSVQLNHTVEALIAHFRELSA